MDTATKKEFKKVNTGLAKIRAEFRKDLKGFRKGVNERFEKLSRNTDERFDKLSQNILDTFVTKAEFEEFTNYVYENMFTKQDYMKLMSNLDEMFLEFKHTQNNNILIGKQLCDLDDTVAGHSKRITVIEERILH